MTAKSIFHSLCKVFDALVFFEIHRLIGAHFFGKRKALFFPVHRSYIFNAHRAQNGNADQTDRPAALHDHSAVETEDTRRLCALHGMHQNSARFYQNSRI